jgi:maleamate amidohydrolase
VSQTAPEWLEFVPAEERALYQRAGYRGGRALSGRPALLVIDVTKGFTGTRALPVREAMAEFPTSCGEAAWAALPAIRRLLDAFRTRELPVVFTRRDEAAQAAFGGATKRVRVPSGGSNDFVELVAPARGEWICEKARASAFYGTALEAFLHVRQVKSVVVCGGTTSGCVRASCVDAFSAGLDVVVAADGCFDRARHPHLANLFDIDAKYGTVTTSEDVLAQLAALG